jgi:hypothetical protein
MTIGPKSTELLMLINQQTGLADHIRMDVRDSGDVTITIPDQSYVYSKQKNEVTLLGQELLTNDLNFKDVINSLVRKTGAEGGQVKITKSFNETEQKEMIAARIIRQDESIAGEFLIDPDSNLPVYIGTEGPDGELNYMGPIEYDVELSENAFEFIIPQGAKVIDNRPEELKVKQPERNRAFSFDLSETATAMKQAHNVHGIWIDRKGRRVNSWGRIDPVTGLITTMRLEYEDGGLYIMTDDKTYFEDDGMIAVKDGQYIKSKLLFNEFVTAAALRVMTQDEMTVQKQFSEEFQREVIRVDYKNPHVHLQTIVDMDTKRPIKFDIPWTSDPIEPLDHTELIEYNVDLPPGFFEFETGPDAIVIGSHLDNQFANDPNFGIAYDDNEDLQQY